MASNRSRISARNCGIAEPSSCDNLSSNRARRSSTDCGCIGGPPCLSNASRVPARSVARPTVPPVRVVATAIISCRQGREGARISRRRGRGIRALFADLRRRKRLRDAPGAVARGAHRAGAGCGGPRRSWCWAAPSATRRTRSPCSSRENRPPPPRRSRAKTRMCKPGWSRRGACASGRLLWARMPPSPCPMCSEEIGSRIVDRERVTVRRCV